MIRMSVPFSRRCIAKLWRNVCSVTRLVRPAAFAADRQAACNTVGSIQIKPRSDKPPVGTQDAKQLGRQHHVTILPSFAVAHLDDTTGAVDVFDPQSRDLGDPEPGYIGGGERGADLQARHGLEELHDFVGAQYHRQLEGFSRVGNAFRNERFPERDAIDSAPTICFTPGHEMPVETRCSWKA